jgi:hypothetical protein
MISPASTHFFQIAGRVNGALRHMTKASPLRAKPFSYQALYLNYFGIGLNVSPRTSMVWVMVRIATVESFALVLASAVP